MDHWLSRNGVLVTLAAAPYPEVTSLAFNPKQRGMVAVGGVLSPGVLVACRIV